VPAATPVKVKLSVTTLSAPAGENKRGLKDEVPITIGVLVGVKLNHKHNSSFDK